MLEETAEARAREEARRRIETTTRVVLRPLGSPIPLGLFGLAGATLVLAAYQLGWVGAAERADVGLMLLAFAFPAQLLASVWSTLGRDGLAATALGVLALTWLATALVLLRAAAAPGGSNALGVLLLASSAAMAITGSITATSKLVPGLVFLVASLRFLAGGIGELSANEAWENAAGSVGLVLFLLAVYGALAAGIEEARGKTILPLGRRALGKVAVQGDLYDQAGDAPRRAGVRVQL